MEGSLAVLDVGPHIVFSSQFTAESSLVQTPCYHPLDFCVSLSFTRSSVDSVKHHCINILGIEQSHH